MNNKGFTLIEFVAVIDAYENASINYAVFIKDYIENTLDTKVSEGFLVVLGGRY